MRYKTKNRKKLVSIQSNQIIQKPKGWMFSWGIYAVVLILILITVISRIIPYDKKIREAIKLKYVGQHFILSPVTGTIKQIQVDNSELIQEKQIIAQIIEENREITNLESSETGMYVYAGKPIVAGDRKHIGDTLGYIIPTLQSSEAIYGEIYLTSNDISKISIGNQVNIFIGQRKVDTPIRGNVCYISAIPSRSGAFSILVKLDQTELRSLLKDGQYIPALAATAEIVFKRSNIFNEITDRIRIK